MILLTFVISLLFAQHTSITIADDGTDNLDCLIGKNPCKTVNYALKNQKFLPDLAVAVSEGKFTVTDCLYINETEQFHFSGKNDQTVLKSIANGEHTTFSLIKGSEITLKSFAVLSDYNSIVIAQESSNVTFQDITFSNYEFKGTFFSPFVLDKVTYAKIDLESSPNIRIPANSVEINYYITATESAEIVISFDTTTRSTIFSSDCGIASFINCESATIYGITIHKNSGNMIYADDCGSISIIDCTITTPEEDNTVENFERQVQIANRLQGTSTKPSAGHTKSHLPLIQFETSIISVLSTKELRIVNNIFERVWGGCVKAIDVQEMSIDSTIFRSNVLYLSPSSFSPKDPTDKDDLWSGYGCSVHAENVENVELVDVKSVNNTAEMKFHPTSASNGAHSFTPMKLLSSDCVASNFFFKNADSITLLRIEFSFDDFRNKADTEGESIIVPHYQAVAPRISNLGHTASMRAYADVFITRATSVDLYTIKAVNVFSTVLAIDRTRGVFMRSSTFESIGTTCAVFDESAVWIGGAGATNSFVDITESSFHSILPFRTSIDSAHRIHPTRSSNANAFEDIYNDIHTKAAGGALSISKTMSVQCNELNFEECSSNGNGGGCSQTEVTHTRFSYTTFRDCFSRGSGGGLFLQLTCTASILLLEDVSFKESSCLENGGGMALVINTQTPGTKQPTLYFDKVEASLCRASEGGGVWLSTCGDEAAAGDLHGTVILNKVKLTSNHALFGGGLFARTSSKMPLLLVSSEVKDCESLMGGAAVMLNIPLVSVITEAVSSIEDSQFTNNSAEGTGSALLVTLESPKTELEVDKQFVFIKNNTVKGNAAAGHQFSLSAGTITVASNFAANSLNPTQVLITENIVDGSKSAGVTAMGIGGSILKNSFGENNRTIGEFTIPINIECSFSKLTVGKDQWKLPDEPATHTFEEKKGKEDKPRYHCDQTCITFEDTETKCDSTGKQKGKFSGAYLDSTNYPLLPQVNVTIPKTLPSNPHLLVSTSAASVPQPIPNADPIEQYIPATALKAANEDEMIVSVANETTLVGFGEKPPKALFLFASADGLTWSEPIKVQLQSAKSRKTAAAVCGGILGGCAILAVIAILVLICVWKRKSRDGYQKLEGANEEEKAMSHSTNYS
ncbi:hypothetical protein BLNAU_20094 [Blattamonas nauphoetae]|uniref:Uncharacterized protein n=1 Tax=Blattamonas nauphoetae TaxID=2049346 RepID=A0ABQ9WZM0_9EUKA|nr:hypothetical protein BLNAU_20094 [Blattamonas nauphoetae]